MKIEENKCFSYEIVNNNKNETLVMVPGGPGLYCDSFKVLFSELSNKYNLILIELKYDASLLPINILESWKKSLIDISYKFEKLTWFGHSFGGMLVQSIKEIEDSAFKIILSNTSPDMEWQNCLSSFFLSESELKTIDEKEKRFYQERNNLNFKDLFVAWSPYYFNEEFSEVGKAYLSHLSYNYASYLEIGPIFFSSYKSLFRKYDNRFLIITGEKDNLTPKKLFLNMNIDKDKIIEVPYGGHFPWVENYEFFIDLILKF